MFTQRASENLVGKSDDVHEVIVNQAGFSLCGDMLIFLQGIPPGRDGSGLAQAAINGVR